MATAHAARMPLACSSLSYDDDITAIIDVLAVHISVTDARVNRPPVHSGLLLLPKKLMQNVHIYIHDRTCLVPV